MIQNYTPQYYLNALLTCNEKIVFEIYQKFYPSVECFVLQNRGNQNDAKEVFQNVLFQLTVRVKMKHIDIQTSFGGYIYTACKNLWRRELNNRKRYCKDLTKDVSDTYNYDEHYDNQAKYDLMHCKINEMSSRYQSVLTYYLKHNDYDRIVSQFGYSNRNVAFQSVHKSKERLKALVKSDVRYKLLKFNLAQ